MLRKLVIGRLGAEIQRSASVGVEGPSPLPSATASTGRSQRSDRTPSLLAVFFPSIARFREVAIETIALFRDIVSERGNQFLVTGLRNFRISSNFVVRRWGGHDQFLAYNLTLFIYDHYQLAIVMAERQAVPALILAAPTFDTPPDGPAPHLFEKIRHGEFHCARGYGRIDFGHSVHQANHSHFNASEIGFGPADSTLNSSVL
jgi:hypothetical protein